VADGVCSPLPRRQNEPLDVAGTAAAFEALASEVNAYEAEAGRPPKSVDEVAMGFVRVANEAMCRPIRALTQVRAGGRAGGGGVLCGFGRGRARGRARARSRQTRRGAVAVAGQKLPRANWPPGSPPSPPNR
jgi:N-methylhydantoinase A/oxoprolinase/acetone carboxylase beta subunit